MLPGLCALLMPAFAFAQIFIGAGIPDSSALLELKSTEKGFLLPRITDIQRDSIALPATGLMIFNISKKCVEINYGRPEAPYWSCLAFAPEEELRCGAYIAPEVWQEFMCYNLGAAYTGQDSARLLSPSWEINGGYWQWGRKAMAAPGPTGPGQQQANSGEIAGWIGEEWAADTAWTGESKTENDPCPEGYRVPVLEIWQALLDNNPLTYIGSTWSEVGATNYENGIKLGEKLFLPAAGFRSFDGGYLVQRGIMGSYWSSQAYIEYIDAYFFYFDNFSASTSNFLVRTDGRSVRCAKIESGVEVFPPTVITGLTGPTGTINATAAVVAGEVLQTGGAPVTARGFVWSENPSPIVSSASKTINGEGTGFYEGVLDSLEPGKTYYYRAYATNSAGTGYGEEFSFNTSAAVTPIVNTYAAGSITDSSAVGGGFVESDGGAPVLERGVVWNTMSNPEISLSSRTSDGSGLGAFSSTLNGLAPGTTYYYRAYARSSSGTGYGNEEILTTDSVIPTIITSPVQSISAVSAFVGGTVTATGGAVVTARGVVWDTTPGPEISLSTKIAIGNGPGNFGSLLGGLSPGRTYYLRAYATNSLGTAYGAEQVFTTLTQPPTVQTTAISDINGDSARSGGAVILAGGLPVLSRGVVWGTSSGPTIALSTKTMDSSGTGTFVSTITGLGPGLTYYVRAYATNSAGTGYGNELTFMTPVLVPGVTTTPVSAILEGSAVSGGTITSTGGAVVLSRGVVWDTASSPTIALPTKITDSLSGANFQSQISGLSPGTLYYVRAFATNQAGTGYGAARSFRTATALPTVSTSAVAVITGTSAVTGGAVLSTGGATVSERGVVWSLSPGPTVTLSTKTMDGSGPGSFTSMPDGLSPGRTYYLRAYATNSKGTAYGQEILFSTPVMVPSLSTDVTVPVTYTIPITGQQITEYRSASSGGTVSSNGGSTPYARGVVWGTQSGPTTALATKTNEGAGDGKFVSVIRNLRQSTTYYIRAYATNSAGTGYGNEVIYTTPNYCGAYVAPDVWKTFMCYNLGAADTLGDPFVPGWEIVGGYWQWGRINMAAPGPAGSSSDAANAGFIAGWNTTAAANGAWSNGSKSLSDPCPEGFRIPTDAQWRGVLAYNSPRNTGTSWTISATNYASGKMMGGNLFLPAAGYRDFENGQLIVRGAAGAYWSSTEHAVLSSYAWGLNFAEFSNVTDRLLRTFGFSVRCIAE